MDRNVYTSGELIAKFEAIKTREENKVLCEEITQLQKENEQLRNSMDQLRQIRKIFRELSSNEVKVDE